MTELQQRFGMLLTRLRTTYDGIGHSSGRPYVYFVYPPEREKMVLRMVDDATASPVGDLAFVHVDLLPLVMQVTAGQEVRREELLCDPKVQANAADSVMKLWVNAIGKQVVGLLAAPPQGRPVIAFRGLAALHPLGNPTGLMELLAEKEIRDPRTNRMVPIVVLVPGTRPPQTSRIYDFLGLESLRFDFYRGEEA